MAVNPLHKEGDFLGQRARPFKIDQLVRKGDYPSAPRMAKILGVDTRTVQRDIEYMRLSLNAPLEYDQSRKGWYYTDPNFFLPTVALTDKDVFAIFVAQRAVEQYEGTPVFAPLREAFNRIVKLLPEENRVAAALATERIRFAGRPPAVVAPDVWDALVTAVGETQILKIVYESPAETTVRELEPYGLVVRDGDWYVFGHCRLRDEKRTFYLPRVKSAEHTGDFFDLPGDFDFRDYVGSGFEGLHYESCQPVEVCLRFSAAVAQAAQERPWVEGQQNEPLKSGQLEIAFTTDALDPVLRRVLAWGKHVEVIAPEALRKRVIEELDLARRLYGG